MFCPWMVRSRRPGIQPKCFLRTATFRRWSPTAPIEACRCPKSWRLPEICRLGGKSLARIGRRIAAPASAATGLPSTRQTFGNVAASTAWTTLPHFATAWQDRRSPASESRPSRRRSSYKTRVTTRGSSAGLAVERAAGVTRTLTGLMRRISSRFDIDAIGQRRREFLSQQTGATAGALAAASGRTPCRKEAPPSCRSVQPFAAFSSRSTTDEVGCRP